MKIVPDIYIEKNLIYKMVTFKPKVEDKKEKNDKNQNQYEWRINSFIIMKSALIYKVPLIT